jgi:hypothetical protein
MGRWTTRCGAERGALDRPMRDLRLRWLTVGGAGVGLTGGCGRRLIATAGGGQSVGGWRRGVSWKCESGLICYSKPNLVCKPFEIHFLFFFG